jgi:hypothetical protein
MPRPAAPELSASSQAAGPASKRGRSSFACAVPIGAQAGISVAAVRVSDVVSHAVVSAPHRLRPSLPRPMRARLTISASVLRARPLQALSSSGKLEHFADIRSQIAVADATLRQLAILRRGSFESLVNQVDAVADRGQRVALALRYALPSAACGAARPARRDSVFQQTTRIGQKPTLVAALPSCDDDKAADTCDCVAARNFGIGAVDFREYPHERAVLQGAARFKSAFARI